MNESVCFVRSMLVVSWRFCTRCWCCCSCWCSSWFCTRLFWSDWFILLATGVIVISLFGLLVKLTTPPDMSCPKNDLARNAWIVLFGPDWLPGINGVIRSGAVSSRARVGEKDVKPVVLGALGWRVFCCFVRMPWSSEFEFEVDAPEASWFIETGCKVTSGYPTPLFKRGVLAFFMSIEWRLGDWFASWLLVFSRSLATFASSIRKSFTDTLPACAMCADGKLCSTCELLFEDSVLGGRGEPTKIEQYFT